MDKQICVASYWLGIVSVILTVVFRGLAAVGIWPNLVPSAGANLSYNTFHRAAEMFFLLSIAAGLMNKWRSDKS